MLKKAFKLFIFSIPVFIVLLFTRAKAYAWWTNTTYHIEIAYVYEDGTKAFDTISGNLTEGGRYEVNSKEIEGFFPDQEVVSGYLYSDTYITVTYYKLKTEYTLTINYLYNNEKISESYYDKFNENYEYNIESPSIEGYTPDLEFVTGTLTEDTIINVNYSLNKYELKINYYLNNELIDSYINEFNYNEEYDISSPSIEGYTPTIDKVNGIIKDDIEYNVYYNINTYSLTIHFMDDKGHVINNDLIYNYNYNEDYNILLPEIRNCEKPYESISGVLKEDKEITVIYIRHKYHFVLHYVDEDYNDLLPVTEIDEYPFRTIYIPVPRLYRYQTGATHFLYETEEHDANLYVIYKKVSITQNRLFKVY